MNTPDPTHIDFLDAATFADGIPHRAYRWLRDEAPVTWHDSAGDPGYWLVTRHQDVHQALVDAASFSSWRGTTNMREEAPERIEMTRLLLINMDPPSHTRYRRLITRAFAVRAVEKMEARVAEMARRVLDRVLPRGECDFVAEVASRVPTQVIFELLGVPEADWDRLTEWSDCMVGVDDPDVGGNLESGVAAAMQLYGYAFQMATLRRADPGDDLVSLLTTAEVDGERLDDGEINAFFLLLVIAGNETTRNLLSGGLLALLEHPAELARLRADRSLLPGAVEEMLRWVSPVTQFRRTAVRDLELGGKKIREGQKVIIAHASGNFDERVFAAPERFDITRHPNPHVSFGVGPHLCIGASLARLETRLMLGQMLDRMDDIALAGPVSRMRSNYLNSIKSMPIRFRATG